MSRFGADVLAVVAIAGGAVLAGGATALLAGSGQSAIAGHVPIHPTAGKRSTAKEGPR